jgi:tetratricopeptide (TPR) repeat protein
MEAGRVLVALGTPAEALVPYQRAASLQRQLDGRVREAAGLDASGEAYQALSRHQDATEFHRYAVDTFRRFDERWALAVGLHNLAAALLTTGAPQTAATHLNEAAALLAAYDDPAARHLRTEVEALHRPSADYTPTT